MPSFTDVATLIPTLGDRLVDGGDAERTRAALVGMTDADVVAVLEETAALANRVDQIQTIAAGIVAQRSARDRGHSGLSQVRGHRSATALVQNITGSTKTEANRRVRVGEALLDEPRDAVGESVDGGCVLVDTEGATQPAPAPWYQPLRDALSENRLTAAQFDAIRRGLGELPESDDIASAEERTAFREGAHAAWMQASEHLVEEAGERTVEELWQAARTVRDVLDPEGAEARFLARFERRSFRTFRGQDGRKHVSMALEDEGELFLDTVLAAALRPRRGGPRFVDPDEKAQAASLADDQRTNDQLAYDLIMDVLRAGVLADAESVFGTRQAGVRLVQTVDAEGRTGRVAHSEDHLVSVPAAVAEQQICTSGFVPVTIDSQGNPLDVGREHRLFTPKQRIAIAIRDGGCRWRGCDRPASYCEAHHIDEWSRDQGRTDIDRGMLLCRYHHMQLHHGGWRITRDDGEDFVLHHRSGESVTLRPRAVLRYAFRDIHPPPKRFRPAA